MTTRKLHLVIGAPRSDVWRALTDASVTPAYYFGFVADFDDLSVGAPYTYRVDGVPVITGHLRAVEEGAKLGMTFAGTWNDDVAQLPESTVTFQLGDPPMNLPGLTHLTLTHDGLPDTATAEDVERGWAVILSGLKTLLETGRPLVPAPVH